MIPCSLVSCIGVVSMWYLLVVLIGSRESGVRELFRGNSAEYFVRRQCAIRHCDGADAYFGSGSAGDIIGLCQKCRTILQELYHG